MNKSSLKLLHSEELLVELKLDQLRRLPTDVLIASLEPDKPGALKVKTDGTIMDGNHRIKVLTERGVDVDDLPREIWERVI